MKTLKDKSILLIISGGIAAYKSLSLIRLIKKEGAHVRVILTKGGEQFVTPLSVSALAEEEVHTDLWSLKDETEMGHIRLSREADLIVIAPASADLIAKMANGMANDLASTTLLANHDTPVLIAPAMNHAMWNNAATQDNIAKLSQRGIIQIGPDEGDMACGEHGPGRMSEPEDILSAVKKNILNNVDTQTFKNASKPLKGYKALVTSGPTFEPIDPVRFIGNRSSGKQGHAIATALMQAGADVTLITGPVTRPDPAGVRTLHVETAAQMLKACEAAIPTDIAVCAAAVGDWTPETPHTRKIKKKSEDDTLNIQLQQNPDILKTLSNHKKRPQIVVGFAAETNDLLDNAQSKLKRKGCDLIIANDVAAQKVFGADENHVYLISHDGTTEWPHMSKNDIATKLTETINDHLQNNQNTDGHEQHAAE